MRTRTRTLLALAAALAVALPLAGTVAGGDPGAPPVAAPVTSPPVTSPPGTTPPGTTPPGTTLGVDGDPALSIGTEQVAEGAAVYTGSCAECHGARLEGFAHFPPLVGAAFRSTWGGRPVGELHTYVVEQMPLGAGGTLSDEAYAAVVAYLLERNGFEPGAIPFDPSDETVVSLDLNFED